MGVVFDGNDDVFLENLEKGNEENKVWKDLVDLFYFIDDELESMDVDFFR